MVSKSEQAWYSSWLHCLFSLVQFQSKKNHVDTIVQQYLNISKSKIPHFSLKPMIQLWRKENLFQF